MEREHPRPAPPLPELCSPTTLRGPDPVPGPQSRLACDSRCLKPGQVPADGSSVHFTNSSHAPSLLSVGLGRVPFPLGWSPRCHFWREHQNWTGPSRKPWGEGSSWGQMSASLSYLDPAKLHRPLTPSLLRRPSQTSQPLTYNPPSLTSLLPKKF